MIPNGITYTGKIRFSAGSVLYVEGALNASSQNIFELCSNSSKIVVQSNGSLNTVNAAINMWAGELHNYGLMLLLVKQKSVILQESLIIREHLK